MINHVFVPIAPPLAQSSGALHAYCARKKVRRGNSVGRFYIKSGGRVNSDWAQVHCAFVHLQLHYAATINQPLTMASNRTPRFISAGVTDRSGRCVSASLLRVALSDRGASSGPYLPVRSRRTRRRSVSNRPFAARRLAVRYRCCAQ